MNPTKTYYDDVLYGNRLRLCYDLAPPRIQQYLAAEIAYVLQHLLPGGRVLELGCGYGRVLARLADGTKDIFGIDISLDNIKLAGQLLAGIPRCRLFVMDAVKLACRDKFFDQVVCIQNGISAFHVDPVALIQESIRVTKECGQIIFSSYSPRIWPERIKWFKVQAEAGLIGTIDWQQTKDGTIVCHDGFSATTVTPKQFYALARDLPVRAAVEEVDGSSIFCVFNLTKDPQERG